MTNHQVTLHGRIIIQGRVKAVTGLHVGGAAGALEIGGVDSPVIRNPLDNMPYLPGSTMRGKMRSLTERWNGSDQNFPINRTPGKEVMVHMCQSGGAPNRGKGETSDEYNTRLEQWRANYHNTFNDCPVCSVFGVTGDEPVPHPTSLVVRDAVLSARTVADMEQADTDYPFTEIKWEATIDRVTSAAVPRQIERVPAGAVFEGFELVYNIYDRPGRDHFKTVMKALQLVEEDYLGGLGSRGGGKVEFQVAKVYARKGVAYEAIPFEMKDDERVSDDLAARINQWVKDTFADLPE